MKLGKNKILLSGLGILGIGAFLLVLFPYSFVTYPEIAGLNSSGVLRLPAPVQGIQPICLGIPHKISCDSPGMFAGYYRCLNVCYGVAYKSTDSFVRINSNRSLHPLFNRSNYEQNRTN